jgi:uncharacterized protein (TIGR03663 family)
MDLKAKIKAHWPEALILLAAAAARLVLLSIKPPHFDEGVNGWFVDQMTHTGFYHYDPTNYHGPFHFYVLFLAQTLFGRHIWALRLPLALISLATVALTIRFDRFIGRNAALWAAAAMAVSPGSVFYARYAIHEDWLVFSLMLIAWGLMGIWQSGERKYLWAVWIGVTGAVLTKETYIIHFAACALTIPCVVIIGLLNAEPDCKPLPPQKWTALDMGLGGLMFIGAVLFFYSGCGMDIPGLWGLLTTFNAWFHTGQTGNGHEKVWFYWIKLFGRYEWPSCIGLAVTLPMLLPRSPRWVCSVSALLAAVWLGWCGVIKIAAKHGHYLWHTWGEVDVKTEVFTRWLTWPYLLLCAAVLVAVACAAPRVPRFVRALAIYGIGALTAYSIVHYKTPWCIVSLTWPFMLLFGYGVDCAMRKFQENATVLAGVLLYGSACFMIFLNFYHYTDAHEMYVYVQTFPEINDVVNPIYKLAARDPGNYQISGNILLESYHPLPWLLDDFPNIGYYDDNTNPPKMDADFVMADLSRASDVESQLHEPYYTEVMTLRDAQSPSKVYFNAKTFAGVFPGRRPEFRPKPEASPSPSP